MFCPKCGTENPEGTSFCPRCGTGLGLEAKPAEGGAKPEAESSTGMSANTAGLLCYLFTWITGIIFVVIEKKSTFVRFHAWQSIMTFGVLAVASLILLIPIYLIVNSGWDPYRAILVILIIALIGGLIGVLSFVLWIILMIQPKAVPALIRPRDKVPQPMSISILDNISQATNRTPNVRMDCQAWNLTKILFFSRTTKTIPVIHPAT